MNLSSVLSIYPSFRNAHSEQYHQISDILIHDIRPLPNPTLLATDMVLFCTKHNITDCHADSCRRMRIVWWSSASPFCTWLLVLPLNLICILLVFLRLISSGLIYGDSDVWSDKSYIHFPSCRKCQKSLHVTDHVQHFATCCFFFKVESR
jgi:hypothetical protein